MGKPLIPPLFRISNDGYMNQFTELVD